MATARPTTAPMLIALVTTTMFSRRGRAPPSQHSRKRVQARSSDFDMRRERPQWSHFVRLSRKLMVYVGIRKGARAY
eukprot:4372288-Pyramimonas_sp.AAC.1